MTKDIVVIDIDGCLNHYPAPLKMWAEVLLNLDSAHSGQAIKRENDFYLLKETYRHSEIFRYFLPREGAQETLEKIKNGGYFITLLTSRNVNKNPLIKTITINWLKKYEVPFDSVVFAKDKSVYVRNNKDKIMMIVEDEPKDLKSFERFGIKTVVFKNVLNENIGQSHFQEAFSWKEIDSIFERLTR